MNAIRWSEKQSILFLFPMIISISFAMDVFVPAIPAMNHYFLTTDSIMQASLYGFMISMAIGQLFVGPLADYYGRRHIAIASSLLFLLGSLLAALASNIVVFILARVIQALGSCGTYLLCFIIIRDNFSTAVCARLFSILCGINAMIASAAPFIGGLLIDKFHDWHVNFYFLSILGLVMSMVALLTIPNYVHSENNLSSTSLFKTFLSILSNQLFRQYALLASLSLLGLYLFCALSPYILIKQLHLSATHYGLWFGLNALTVFLSNIISARLTYSYPLEKIAQGGVLWIIASCSLMLVLNSHTLTVIYFMLPMLCITFGIGISMGSATALALSDFKNEAATATALLGTCQFGLAGSIGFIVAQAEAKPAMLVLPVMICCLIFLTINLKRKYRMTNWV